MPNRTFEWLGTDSEKNFNNNKKEHFDLLEKNGWIDKKIIYKFNSHGFRCDEFTNDPTIMFLGCSMTLGVGMTQEDTWTYQVAQKLNLRLANLGIGGSSCDTAFRLCYEYIDKINPKIVVIRPPQIGRIELFLENDEPEHLGPWISDGARSHISLESYYKKWIISESNSKYQKLKNLLAIEKLCIDRKIKFYNTENSETENLVSDNSIGRDLMHPGIDWHNSLAYTILKDLAQ